MTWRTFRISTANCMTVRQFRSVCTTRLATLRWTNSSPGRRPTIWFAGTRLSEQPIQRYSGNCCRESFVKKSGSCSRMLFAQALLRSKRWLRSRMACDLSCRRLAQPAQVVRGEAGPGLAIEGGERQVSEVVRLQQVVRQYGVFPQLAFVERVQAHPVPRVDRVRPKCLPKRRVDVVVGDQRLESPAAEAAEGVELEAPAAQERVHVGEHGLPAVELDELDLGLNEKGLRQRPQRVAENRQLAALDVDLDEVDVVYFGDVVYPPGVDWVLADRRHHFRQVLEFLEQRGAGLVEGPGEGPVGLVEGCRLSVTDEKRKEAVRLPVLRVQALAFPRIRLEPGDPRAPGIHQRLIGRAVAERGADIEDLDLDLFREEVEQAPHRWNVQASLFVEGLKASVAIHEKAVRDAVAGIARSFRCDLPELRYPRAIPRAGKEQQVPRRDGDDDVAVDDELTAGPYVIQQQQAGLVVPSSGDDRNQRPLSYLYLGQQLLQVGDREAPELAGLQPEVSHVFRREIPYVPGAVLGIDDDELPVQGLIDSFLELLRPPGFEGLLGLGEPGAVLDYGDDARSIDRRIHAAHRFQEGLDVRPDDLGSRLGIRSIRRVGVVEEDRGFLALGILHPQLQVSRDRHLRAGSLGAEDIGDFPRERCFGRCLGRGRWRWLKTPEGSEQENADPVSPARAWLCLLLHGSDLAEYLRAARERLLGLREAEAQDAVGRRLAVEHRYRDGGDSLLLREADRKIGVLLVADRVVGEVLEEGAARGQGLEARSLHAPEKEIALPLVEAGQGEVGIGVLHELGERVLQRAVGDEHVELVHLAELDGDLLRRWRVPHLPAG